MAIAESIDLDDDDIVMFKRAADAVVNRGVAIIGVDPGSSSTGWCVSRGGVVVASGQCRPRAAVKELQRVAATGAGLLVIEEPAFIGKGRQWVLAWCGGELRGRLASLQFDEDHLWTPTPSTWRSVMGFRQTTDGAAEDAVAFARRHGQHCLTPGGKPEIDRAMAVGLCFAAHRVCATFATAPAVAGAE